MHGCGPVRKADRYNGKVPVGTRGTGGYKGDVHGCRVVVQCGLDVGYYEYSGVSTYIQARGGGGAKQKHRHTNWRGSMLICGTGAGRFSRLNSIMDDISHLRGSGGHVRVRTYSCTGA